MDYSIVVPVYNESDKISASITQITTFMRTYAESFELVIVDDGSEDNTVEIVEEYMTKEPAIRLIKNLHKGKGPTVRTGVLAAQGDLIYMCDTDLSSPISEIKKLSVWIKDQDYDVAIASREGVGAERIDEPFYRHFMGRIFNLVVRMIALPGIQDSQCGFKLYRGTAAKEIFSKLKIYGEDAPVQKKAYLGAFDVEVLYLAKKLGYKVRVVPVSWKYVNTTRLNPAMDSLKMFRDVLKIKINDLRGYY
jgi:dolichyl-phosphate beta-glucosyltransferase